MAKLSYLDLYVSNKIENEKIKNIVGKEEYMKMEKKVVTFFKMYVNPLYMLASKDKNFSFSKSEELLTLGDVLIDFYNYFGIKDVNELLKYARDNSIAHKK